MESDDFTRHYIIRYLSARELVLPPLLEICPYIVEDTNYIYTVLLLTLIKVNYTACVHILNNYCFDMQLQLYSCRLILFLSTMV